MDERLIAEGEALVRSIATKVHRTLPAHVEIDDLIAAGRLGLVEAAERFDPRCGASFTTFAYYRVRGAIYDGLRHMGWVGRREYRRARAAEQAAEYLSQLAERDAGAVVAGAPVASDPSRDLAEALAGIATVVVTSLEAMGGEDALPPGIAADSEAAPDRMAEVGQLSGALREALVFLPDKERRLLELIYFKDKSIKEAGEALGVSKSWASRMHARAIDILRDHLAVRS